MLELKHARTPVNPGLGAGKRKSHSVLTHGPLELSEKTLGEFLAGSRKTRLTPQQDLAFLAPFELVARAKGELVVSEWIEGISPFRAINELRGKAPAIDVFQLTVVTGRVPVAAELWQQTLVARKTGRFGLEVSHNGSKHRVSPLQSIATNRVLAKYFSARLEEKHLTPEEFFAGGGELHLLECRQFVLQCGKSAAAIETYRGNRVIAADDTPEKLSERLISGIARWFMANQDGEGGLPYKYWPSSGIYSDSDNPIRRFMASVAFNRMAHALDRQDMKVAARKNLDYNFRRFYRVENGLGVIAWDGSAKLGSLALAALAILESPFAETWKVELAELRRTINTLWQPSGAFRTFVYPADRNDNQNFYPGEALLFWAISLQKNRDDALLAQAIRSVYFYRSHFHKDANPAFVPWHSQAAVILYRLTGDQGIRDFVFEMNDWLLPHQQWGGSVDPDHWGRFYSPHKPKYGPPHASSTGVYLEGLVDALVLAREAGDAVRAATYKQAIDRGIRSLAQLQFRDELDAYYISRKERVIGALRTETYNNEIRIDNLQHGLMALLKYRELYRDGRQYTPTPRGAQPPQPAAAQ